MDLKWTLAWAWGVAAAVRVAAVPVVSSGFDSGDEGWTVVDRGTHTYEVRDSYAVVYQGAGGNPGGFVERQDPTANSYGFQAPATFLGDRSGYIGETLEFSLRSDSNDYAEDSVVLLIGDGKRLVHDFGGLPSVNVWHDFSIPLQYDRFLLNYRSEQGGTAISEATFQAVMGNLTGLWISAEFGGEAGQENTDLDNVRLVPEPGTLPLVALALLATGLPRRRR